MMQCYSYHEGLHGHVSTVLFLKKGRYSQPFKRVSIHVHLKTLWCPSLHLQCFFIMIF